MPLQPLLDELRASTRDFLAALTGVSRSEWTWQPAPESWSLYQVAEHTCVVQRGIERLYATKLLEQPITAEGPTPRWTDADIRERLGRGGDPIRAPGMVLPKGRWASQEGIAQVFTDSAESLIGWVQSHPEVDLRAYGHIHPMMGQLDGVQWLIMVAAHNRRHAEQVKSLRRRYAEVGG